MDNVGVVPILLQKGDAKLALYGLGNIRDERLHRTFLSKKVKLFRPKKDQEDWFNVTYYFNYYFENLIASHFLHINSCLSYIRIGSSGFILIPILI